MRAVLYLMQLAIHFAWHGLLLHFVGSRMNKQWFLVRDSRQEIDAVLTMVPWSLQCMLTFNKATRKTLKELFSLLQVCMYMYVHEFTWLVFKWRKTTCTCQEPQSLLNNIIFIQFFQWHTCKDFNLLINFLKSSTKQ